MWAVHLTEPKVEKSKGCVNAICLHLINRLQFSSRNQPRSEFAKLSSNNPPASALSRQHGMESEQSARDTRSRDELLRESLERYEAPLVRYALSLTGDLDSARDVVQDTFLRLCQQSPGAVEDHLAQWLFTVCRNRALDVLRKDRRMTPLTDLELDHRPAPEPSPAETAASRDTAGQVEALLTGLPANQREVVRLKFQHHLSYQEIAAVTSLSVGNVGFLLHTALKTLRGRLEKLEQPRPVTHPL